MRTKWKEFVKLNKENPVFVNLIGQPGTSPHEFFEHFVNEEKEILKKHKPSFKTLIKVTSSD